MSVNSDFVTGAKTGAWYFNTGLRGPGSHGNILGRGVAAV